MVTVPAMEMALGDFAARGFAIVPAKRRDRLDALREAIFAKARSLVPYRGEDVATFFNQFHTYGLDGTALNAFRMELVDAMTREMNVSRTLYAAFGDSLTALVGADVVAQKTVNLVVQQPGDSDQVPIHRDAPSNSHFEVILWLPLVDVYRTKSMFAVEREHTAAGLAQLKAGGSFDAFAAHARAHGIDLAVRYGEAFLFAAGIAHGCKVNVEPETRWSLNVRFKNLFSPYGAKGLAEFFEIIALSPLSRVGFAFEGQEFGIDPA